MGFRMRNQAPGLLRQQLLVDQNVQGSLLQRTALYSAASVIYFFIILIFREWISSPSVSFLEAVFSSVGESTYWVPGFMLLIPIVAYDLLRLTNRFAGPFFRLRREMQRLARDESETSLRFREGDFWVEIADDFNSVREELLRLRKFHAEHSRMPKQPAFRQEQVSDLTEANQVRSRSLTD